jgi:hypothetical protein
MDELLETIKELEDSIPKARIDFAKKVKELEEECERKIDFEYQVVRHKELALGILREEAIKIAKEEAKWGHHKSFNVAHLWVRYVNAPNSLYRNTYYPRCTNSMNNKPIEEIIFVDEDSICRCKHCSQLKGE